jgi:hypothetical protein
MDRITREVIKTDLHTNSINREEGLLFSRSWKPLIHSVRERKRRLLQDGQLFSRPFWPQYLCATLRQMKNYVLYV